MNNITVLSPVLTKYAEGYKPVGFIADALFTQVPVETTFGKIPKMGAEAYRLVNTVVLGKAKNPEITLSVSTSTTFDIDEHALEIFITQKDADGLGGMDTAERMFNDVLSDALMISREKGIADSLQSGSIITQTSSPTAKWNSYSTSDPLADFTLAKNTIFNATGREANVAILPRDTFAALQFHPDLLTKLGFTYAKPGGLTEVDMAVALGVEKVFVGRAVYNSAKQGATEVISPIWTDTAIFGYINYQPGAMVQKTGGYSFLPGNANVGPAVGAFSYVPEGKLQTSGKSLVQLRKYDDVIADVKCFYLFTNVLA